LKVKIITWNCNMAYRKKAAFILAHKPDIVIVPECEHPDKLKFDESIISPNNIVWHGANENKGLAVFSYNNYKLQLLDVHKPRLKTILPIAVTGGQKEFTLFAVWANNPRDKQNQYVGQVWKAIHQYKNLLSGTSAILAGDFNSNTIWDRPRRKGNHSNVVAYLEKKGIYSTYHHHFSQVQGREAHPTLYMYRHEDKPYHIDYCFASKDILDKLETVEVGAYKEWKQLSDHKPLIATFRD